MANKLTHTLGPWFVDGPPWNQIVWSSAENRVCFLAHSNGLDDDRDVATGHLIAASPDLIEFVVKVTNYLEYLPALLELGQMSGHAGNCTILAKQGRAAIAKATAPPSQEVAMRRLTVRDADRFYGEPLARFDAMAGSESVDPVDAAHFKMWCRIAADEIRHARDLQAKAETNCRHWREESGKLRSQLRAGRAKLAEERS